MEPKKYDFEVQIRAGDFEYINLKENGTPDEAVKAFDDLKGAWAKGIPDEAFLAFIYRQVRGEENHVEEYQKMSESQKSIVQAIKRAMKSPLKDKK